MAIFHKQIQLVVVIVLAMSVVASAQTRIGGGVSLRGTLLAHASTATSSPAPETNIYTLDSSRTVPWEPGLETEIPTYPVGVNVKTDYGAVGDGVTDDYSAITNAIAHCAISNAVYFPTGTYAISKSITVNKAIVLRGDGMTNTVIKGTGSGGELGLVNLQGTASGTINNLVSGQTKGSSNIVLATTTDLAIGDCVVVRQTNDPTVLQGNIPNWSRFYQSQIVRVTGISGTTCTLSRPLFFTFNDVSTNDVEIREYTFCTNAGVENMRIEGAGNAEALIRMYVAKNCWFKDIETSNCWDKHILIDLSHKCEARRCYAHHRQAGKIATAGYASCYGAQITYSSDCLVEDCVFNYISTPLIAQDGACGNVFGYNYSFRHFTANFPTDTVLGYGGLSHGGHGIMNLWEGNITTQLGADPYWGSSWHHTWFRNHARTYSIGENANIVNGMQPVEVGTNCLYMNFVANVMCKSNAAPSLWNLETDDVRVTNTIVIHGNHNWTNGTTTYIAGEYTNFAASLYKSAKPSWFAATNAWPPIGPDCTPKVGWIPAKQRLMDYLGLTQDPDLMVYPYTP